MRKSQFLRRWCRFNESYSPVFRLRSVHPGYYNMFMSSIASQAWTPVPRETGTWTRPKEIHDLYNICELAKTFQLKLVNACHHGVCSLCLPEPKHNVAVKKETGTDFASGALCSALPWNSFKNIYGLLKLRALKSQPLNVVHIFWCMGKILCVGIFEIPQKLSYPYIDRYDFIQRWNIRRYYI